MDDVFKINRLGHRGGRHPLFEVLFSQRVRTPGQTFDAVTDLHITVLL